MMHANILRQQRNSVPIDFRAEIKQRLKRLGKSTRWLCDELQSRGVGRGTIYEFLRDPTPGKPQRQIGSDHLVEILNLLERAERSQKQKRPPV
jgi:hypothetical protein